MSKPIQPNQAYDLQAREARQKEVDMLLGNIAVKLMSNETLFNRTFPVIHGVMAVWAGKNPVKKVFAKTALWSMNGTVKSMGKNTDDNSIARDLGRMVQLQWEIKAGKNQEDAVAGADTVANFIRDFLASADFGAWKEMVESSGERQVAAAESMNEVVIDYIGKAFVLLSALPSMLDTTCTILKNMLETQMELQPPDILFEAINGIWSSVDGKKIGEVLNLQYEFTKRFNIGSHLAGDGVRPAIQLLVANVLQEVAEGIDPEVFADMKTGVAENQEAVQNGVADFLKNVPEFGKKYFVHKADVANIKMRSLKNRLQSLASMENFEDIVQEWNQAFDPLEFADLLTSCIETVNIIHEDNPELIPNLLTGLFGTIDAGELEAAVTGVLTDAVQAVKPAVTPLMPSLINNLCDLLTPEPGEDNSELNDALKRLNNILGG